MGSDTHPRLVVGVGASAGGLKAFKELLGAVPSECGMAFLLVQHLSPAHESMLSALLRPHTQMEVRDADHGDVIRPDTVYIIRPDTVMAVRDGRIELSAPAHRRGARLTVDHLFSSLATEYDGRTAGVVLSGAGSDGSPGIREINKRGGLVIAQRPETSGQRGMPQSAIDTGVVDLVLHIREIPAALERFASLPNAAASPQDEDAKVARWQRRLSEDAFRSFTELLETHASFDLRVYKRATIERRTLRRMALAGFEDPEAYLAHLRQAPEEQQNLIRDLLINVTEFFRDPAAFRTLRELVIKPLVAEATEGATLRAWVAACSTGEEAYSIAIELLDAIRASHKRLDLRVFATDIDEEAVAIARAGVYAPTVGEQVSAQRLERYFRRLESGSYRTRGPLRDVLSFATHDLTKDAPFSRMDLVSCRNVLIYLTPDAQRHVLRVLHFALRPDGHLFLSPSESTAPQRELFASLSKPDRVYRKVGRSHALALGATSRGRASLSEPNALPPPAPPAGNSVFSEGDLARRAVLDAVAPPTLVVGEDSTILFAHGDLSPFVRFPEGDNPRFELRSVLRGEYATRVRGILYRCRREGVPQSTLSSFDGDARPVRIAAYPAPRLGSDVVILTFERAETPPARAKGSRGERNDAIVEQLHRELEATREDLQNTIEELESSNEELRASHEESMTVNEELQSANEELEATTEELQSLNEELTTVNAQLRDKIEQVEQAHDDLSNLFASTKIATLFLDENLRIKRFTPAARALLGIHEADVGRSVVDIAREPLQRELARDARQVLDELTPITSELRTSEGQWLSRRVLPYRTESRRIEGVVVTFTDVTELRSMNTLLQQEKERLELAWEVARGGVLEHELPVGDSLYVSEQWAHVLGYRAEELPKGEALLRWLIDQSHTQDRESLERAEHEIADRRTDRYSLELRFRHRTGMWIWARCIARVLRSDAEDHPTRLLRMMIDISDLKRAEESLKESEERFREMADGIPLMVWVHDEAGDQVMVNQTFCRFFGATREEMGAGGWQMRVHPDDAERYTRAFYACIEKEQPFHAESRVKDAAGEWRWVESWGRPRRDASGRFRGLVGTSADITERRRIEESLRESEARFRTLADHISQLAWMASADGAVFWFNKRWYEFTGSTPDEMKGWGWRSALRADASELVLSKLRAHFDAGEEWEDTFPLRGADGAYRWFLSRAVPIHDERGCVVRWFGTNTDVTKLREAEQRLREADQQKDEFLAMLGHELRNPLAAIRTASELLRFCAGGDSDLEKIQRTLERQTRHMGKLLDGLLDISRIIRGKIELELETLDFRMICREVVADAAANAEAHELEIHLEEPSRPLWVDADRVRLTQVVGNLVSNAIKYNRPGGRVDLRLERVDSRATLTVRDTGVGLDPELLPHVFEVFRQSAQSIARSEGGLGIGLALVKMLTELHQGEVRAHSEGRGRGAEFTIEIPYAGSTPPAAKSDHPRGGGHRRIVLIEDNSEAAEMMHDLLEAYGHTVEHAADGEAGVETVRSVVPDAVICDLGLPGAMNGYDVAGALRADPRLRSVLLIAVSGYGRPDDKKRCVEAGFDAHFTKPVEMAAIHAMLQGDEG